VIKNLYRILGITMLFALCWVWPIVDVLNITRPSVHFALVMSSMLAVFGAVGLIILGSDL